MTTRTRIVMAAAVVVLLGGGGVFLAFRGGDRDSNTERASVDLCADHGVPRTRCPFCDPGLIERDGPCRGHGVPEALCYQCRPEIVPGFKATGDWCVEHDVPESQCPL